MCEHKSQLLVLVQGDKREQVPFHFTSFLEEYDMLNSFYNNQSRFIFSRDKSFHDGKFGGKKILLFIPDIKLIIDES